MSSALRASTRTLERLVVDLDQVGGVAGELACLRDDGDHGLADVAHLADGERVVADVRAGRCRYLEERIGRDRDLVAGQRPVHARAARAQRVRSIERIFAWAYGERTKWT